MAHFDESNFFPDTSPGYLVRVIHQLSFAGIDRVFAEEGLTATQWMALVSIHFGFGDTAAALARNLAHDKGAMTRLIDAMEARGWVERTRGDGDRRLVNLSLTDSGLEVAMHARRQVIACWNDWLADWSEDEVRALLVTLQKLRTTLEAKG
jgi:DNA-binding MarR family transcriptional regulator